VFFWYRKKLVSDGLRALVPRVVHPFVYITNGREVMRIVDIDVGRIRTCGDNKKWEYTMSSTEFRKRVAKAHDRVRNKQAAFAPDPRFKVQHWQTREAFRDEGLFRTRWMYVTSFGENWDIVPVDERVGLVVYENRPFQMTSRYFLSNFFSAHKRHENKLLWFDLQGARGILLSLRAPPLRCQPERGDVRAEVRDPAG